MHEAIKYLVVHEAKPHLIYADGVLARHFVFGGSLLAERVLLDWSLVIPMGPGSLHLIPARIATPNPLASEGQTGPFAKQGYCLTLLSEPKKNWISKLACGQGFLFFLNQGIVSLTRSPATAGVGGLILLDC